MRTLRFEQGLALALSLSYASQRYISVQHHLAMALRAKYRRAQPIARSLFQISAAYFGRKRVRLQARHFTEAMLFRDAECIRQQPHHSRPKYAALK